MIAQLIKFGIVGVIAALVDVGVLVALKELFSFEVLVASTVSFSVSVCINYLLSMAFVFKSKTQNKIREFVIFVLLSIGGLGINQLILWIGTYLASVYYLIAKALSLVIVPVYNFVTRKIFLEKRA